MSSPNSFQIESSLVEITRNIWKQLIPSLDIISLKLMSFYAENYEREYTLYKAAKALGLSFTTVYKKGGSLSLMRLLERSGRTFKANAKTCIALYSYEILGPRRLFECLKSIWNFKNASELELQSFLALLAYSIKLRELNITNANICFLDEASLNVIRLYNLVSAYGFKLGKIKCEKTSSRHMLQDPQSILSEITGLHREIIIAGIRFAFRSLENIVPPTINIGKHKMWLRITEGGYQIIFVECMSNCTYYIEDLGLSCPYVHRDVEETLKNISTSHTSYKAGGL